MEENCYLGGVLGRSAGYGMPAWAFSPARRPLLLQTRGDFLERHATEDVTVLLRGAAAAPGWARSGQLAREVHRHYLDRRDLPIERLEGSFTVMVLDSRSGRVLLYRNLAGAGNTYYTETDGGLLFASNLPLLLDALPSAPRPNRDALPAFFLFRYVPGRETLFKGIYRLAPGELVSFDDAGLARSQRQTFAPWHEAPRIGRDAVDRVEQVMGEILADYARLRPGTANLLSGGVDSSYLQTVWNRVRGGGARPRSFAVSVDHPVTRADAEYATTAAAALGTQHTFVRADGPYLTYLLDTLAATGEPPNHVQAAYFGTLARAMAADGVTTGLCGEGADSLFGIENGALHEARLLRRLVPFRPARWLGRILAGRLGAERLRRGLDLADRLNAFADFDHPVNRVATFAHWPSVEACFGTDGVAAALAYRRGLLAQCEVPLDPLYQMHLCGYLGEAADSASLWTTVFNRAGGDLLCPFLDSRLLRLATAIDPRHRFRFRRPKDLLRRALARHVPPTLAYRRKLGFGQPIFEWLSPGGQLRPLLNGLARYDFVRKDVLDGALARPNWFLYSLLCYDLWHRMFIDRTVPRQGDGEATAGEALAVATGSA